MSRRFQVLAAHVRQLDDYALNEVLVELPAERFAALCAVALARPCLPDAVRLSMHRSRCGPGAASRWVVYVDRPLDDLGLSTPGTYAHDLGAVAREHDSVAGRGLWRAYTRRNALV